MTRYRRIAKKLALSATGMFLVCHTAFAMPSGGNVVTGDINGIAAGSLPMSGNDVTLQVNGNSLIDWNSFGIGTGEALRFVFQGDGLQVINHVTGTASSQLLGTLTGDRDGHIMLINPNGITVGNGAVINVGALTLSTLDASDSDLKNYLAGTGGIEFFGGKSYKPVTVKGDITASDLLNLYGGSVEIADGVTLKAKNISMAAGQERTLEAGKDTMSSLTMNGKGNAYNDITIKGKLEVDDVLHLSGGKVVFDGAKVEGDVVSVNVATDANRISPSNEITVNNSTIESRENPDHFGVGLYLSGGTVNITNSSIHTTGEGPWDEGMIDGAHSVTVDNSTLVSASRLSSSVESPFGNAVIRNNSTLTNFEPYGANLRISDSKISGAHVGYDYNLEIRNSDIDFSGNPSALGIDIQANVNSKVSVSNATIQDSRLKSDGNLVLDVFWKENAVANLNLIRTNIEAAKGMKISRYDNVTMDHVTMKAANDITATVGGFNGTNGTDVSGDLISYTGTAGSGDGVLTMKDSSMESTGGNISLTGKKIDIGSNSTLTAANIDLAAANSYEISGSDITVKADKENTVNIADSELAASKSVNIMGGKVSLDSALKGKLDAAEKSDGLEVSITEYAKSTAPSGSGSSGSSGSSSSGGSSSGSSSSGGSSSGSSSSGGSSSSSSSSGGSFFPTGSSSSSSSSGSSFFPTGSSSASSSSSGSGTPASAGGSGTSNTDIPVSSDPPTVMPEPVSADTGIELSPIQEIRDIINNTSTSVYEKIDQIREILRGTGESDVGEEARGTMDSSMDAKESAAVITLTQKELRENGEISTEEEETVLVRKS